MFFCDCSRRSGQLSRRFPRRPTARRRRRTHFASAHRPAFGSHRLRSSRPGSFDKADGPFGGTYVKWVAALVAVMILTGLGIMPFYTSNYVITFTLQIFMWIALAESWNLISGLTGYVSFGHVAFFGTGAYTAAILVTKVGWHWLPASLMGSVTAAILALVIGYPCLRLKGPYFAISMLGLNEVVRALVSYFDKLTGGGSGITLSPMDSLVPLYYAMGGVALAGLIITYSIIERHERIRPSHN